MKKMLFAALLLLFAAFHGNGSEQIEIRPDKAEIILPAGSNPIVRIAAGELQKHLKLITGTEIPIRREHVSGFYPFRFTGVPNGEKLRPEEAVFTAGKDETAFYGDDTPFKSSLDDFSTLTYGNRFGTMTAVCCFLEKQFGIKWLWPGDSGIVFPERKTLALNTGTVRWTPQLVMRSIRTGYYSPWHRKAMEEKGKILPQEFRLEGKQFR